MILTSNQKNLEFISYFYHNCSKILFDRVFQKLKTGFKVKKKKYLVNNLKKKTDL